MKWPDSRDPNATFFSEGAYERFSQKDYKANNSAIRPNPEVPLFDAMLEYEEKHGLNDEDKRLNDMLRNLKLY